MAGQPGHSVMGKEEAVQAKGSVVAAVGVAEYFAAPG